MSDFRDTLPKCPTCGAYTKEEIRAFGGTVLTRNFSCGASYNFEFGKFVIPCGKAPEMVATLRAALEQARAAFDKINREVASDTNNRWCQNALIISTTALAAIEAVGKARGG